MTTHSPFPHPARLALATVGLLSVFCTRGSVVRAASVTTDCAGLQAALDNANTGDTIILTELCNISNSGGSFPGTFSLNNGSNDSRSYTLEGQPGSGAGFDGTGAGGRMLSATGASSAPATITLRNLIFENGSQPSTGGAVAFQGEYSVTLDGDTFANNQAPPGPGGAVDIESSAPNATITISNSTFANNQAPDDGFGLGGAVNIVTFGAAGTVAFDNDTFSGNQAGVGGGAIEVSAGASSGSLTVSNSTFANNAAFLDTGGAIDLCECGAPLPVTLNYNTFTGNTVVSPPSFGGISAGGAVSLSNSAGGNATVMQIGNVFSGNSLSGGTGDALGGAEAGSGMTLSSTGDLFTGNSIRAPAAGQISQGAAVSLSNDCSAPVPAHTIANTAIAGNSIADGGTTADAQGAVGLFCFATGNPNSLLLQDATVSGNTGGGGTAGVWGDSGDQLTIQNSILYGDSDGAELTGFTGVGGSVTATFSDLCSGVSPFAGTGNICADPLLANAGAGDVHETSASPAIDAGSNALVPSGVTTDVYGAARIGPRVLGGAAVVDMGAAELSSVSASPSISATASAGVTFGGQIHDTATLSAGDVPTGTITFRLYGPADSTCAGTPAFTNARAVSGNGSYQSIDVTPTQAGAYRWTASYGGDSNNNSVATVCADANAAVTIAQASQTITFSALGNKTFGDPAFTVSATGGGSGNPVTFSSATTSVCTVSGSTVTLVTTGPCTIAADQAGNANYAAAAQVVRSFTVASSGQTITFGALVDRYLTDGAFSVSATASSGLTVTFSSTTTSVCTVSGATVTPVILGTCTVAADQAGNTNYGAAPQVTQSFIVNGPSAARMSLDRPMTAMVVPAVTPFFLGGWALDLGAGSGVGVSAVHLWAYPIVNGLLGTPTFLGLATSALPRADVGALYGSQFNASGWSLTAGGLPAGQYEIVAWAHSAVTGTFNDVQTAVITSAAAGANPVVAVDTPHPFATFGPTLLVTGWTIDAGASTGTGVDAVHVWAYPFTGGVLGTPTFLGTASLGFGRPDVAAIFGAAFASSGYALQSSALAPGPYRLVVFAHSTVSGLFNPSTFVDVTVAAAATPDPWMALENPPANSTQQQPFLTTGWALDFGAAVGPGVDMIHVWATRVSDGTQTFLGMASYGAARSDVAALFGSSFSASGYSLSVTGLTPGTYDLSVFARSTVTGTFNQVQTVRVNVN